MRRIKEGEIVYYVDSATNKIDIRRFDYTDEKTGFSYSSKLYPNIRRYLGITPIEEVTKTIWKRASKNVLACDIHPYIFSPVPEIPQGDIADREYLQMLYNNYFIGDAIQTNQNIYIDTECYKYPKLHYRFVQRCRTYSDARCCENTYYDRMYLDYDEANNRVREEDKKRNELLTMSDYDYSVMEMDRVFKIHNVDKKYRAKFLSLEDFGNVEVSVRNSEVYYRRYGTKNGHSNWIRLK